MPSQRAKMNYFNKQFHTPERGSENLYTYIHESIKNMTCTLLIHSQVQRE